MLKTLSQAFLFLCLLNSCSQNELRNQVESILRTNAPLTKEEMSKGLKQALTQGLEKSIKLLAIKDGFLGDSMVRIPFPSEANKIKKTLVKLGFRSIVDKSVISFNRAAEDASQLAMPIFLSAIKKLTFKDVVKLVKGKNSETTDYLKKTTQGSLFKAFRPRISKSLKKVKATRYWGDVMNRYNSIPFVEKVNPDIDTYVTGLAIKAIFKKIADEEKNIRLNPKARTTELLKRVFSKKEK